MTTAQCPVIRTENQQAAKDEPFAIYQRGVDESLTSYFEDFLKRGTPGDKHFLWDLLSAWDYAHLLSGDGYLVRAAAELLNVEQPIAAGPPHGRPDRRAPRGERGNHAPTA